ncbi:MAG: hypothetical protein ACXACC_09130 [Promethearchaeota archaeon]|jgi:hypothetical protein
MKKHKKISIALITFFMISQALLFFPIQNVKANGILPPQYSEELNLNSVYTYSVLDFGEDSNWINFSNNSEGEWSTNIGDEIRINITGFYNRDPNDVVGDTFSDTDMPWFDIEIFKETNLNFTLFNVSNSELARNLKLGFSRFQSGFLIPNNQTELIKNNATLEANGASDLTADLTMEETFNFLYFRFDQYGETHNQKTELIYDKKTGLLVKANTTLGDFKLALSLTNYTLDIETEYKYEVNTFEPLGWAIWTDLWGNYKDIYATGSERGWILVNFTGFYHRDPLLWDPDPFKYTDGRPWLDIKVVYQGDVRTDITMQMNNISDSECANNLLISFPGFLSGFLLPIVNNETYDIEAEVIAASWFTVDREFTYEETDLTINMYFKCAGSFPQETRLIYEKITGLLLYLDTIGQNYHLEMTIENYEPDIDQNGIDTPSEIPSFSLIVIMSMIIATTLIIIKINKKKMK